jgi:branched-subunit amino acid transport protein
VSAGWVTVVAVGIGTVLLKAVGPVGVAGRRVPPVVDGLLSAIAPAILAALVVTETFASGRHFVVDARLAGAGAGIVLVLLRAPLWLVVVCGALATAGVRALQ